MKFGLVEYLMGLFTIIPITVGFARIKVIHKSYYWLLMYLGIDLLFELTAPFVYGFLYMNIIQNIVHYTSVFCLLILLYKWGYLKNNKSVQRLLLILFVSLLIIELLTQNNAQLKTPWYFMIFSFSWIITAVDYINNGLSNSNRKKTNWSQLLILFPLITTMIYYIILHILMANLYNKETEQLFRTLYGVINFLQIASQLCFALALFWAPKKEVYLESLEEHLSPKMAN